MSRILRIVGLLLLACAAQAATGSAPAANSLQALEHAALSGGGIVLRLTFERDVQATPSVLVSHHPVASITFDFPATASALGKEPVAINRGGVRSVQVIASRGRSRVVVLLDRSQVHETSVEGRHFLITLRRPSSLSQREPAGSLRNVGFESGGAGEGRIVVELSAPSMPVEVRRQGNTLIVDFPGAALADELQRRLDVQDFGTAIRAIETYRVRDGTRMTVELAGSPEFSAYQVSRGLVLAPRPAP